MVLNNPNPIRLQGGDPDVIPGGRLDRGLPPEATLQ
jgi:hypothetical protein